MTAPTAELLFQEQDAVPISIDEATIKSWDAAQSALATAPKIWLSTARPSRGPHAAPVLVVWVDGAPHIATRPASRKARNLEAIADCVLMVTTDEIDLVIEGTATRVCNENALHRVADAFRAKYGWHLSVRNGSSFEDSLPGAPEYGFYRITPSRAFGYGPDGLTATRWRFTK